MHIAVLGGTFDPPHFGHLLMARQVLEEKPVLDMVWLMPANTNPDKHVHAIAHHRLAMTKFLSEPRIEVSDMDVARAGETYTIDTITRLSEDAKNNYYWLMGSDLLTEVVRWQGFKQFSSKIPFIVFPRPEYPVEKVPHNFEVLSKNSLLTANFSSTAIRKRIAEGHSVGGLVPEKVAHYITMHGLYKKARYFA